MERPLYGKDNQNTPLEARDAGRIDDRAAHLKLAGHISLQEKNHTGEVNLRHEIPRTVHVPGVAQVGVPGEHRPAQGPAFQPVQFSQAPKVITPEAAGQDMPEPDRIERSAWHSIALDAEGQVMQTQHGEAFMQETRPEQMMTGAQPAQTDNNQQAPTHSNGQAPSAQQPVVPPVGSPQQPFAQSMQQPAQTPQQFTQPQPMQQPTPSQQSQYGQPMPQPSPFVQQPVNQTYQSAQPNQPMQQYQQPAAMSPLTGAVNPSFPVLPSQPTLPAGQPTHADPQHLLGRPKRTLLKSPWLWLAIGFAMIIYFGASLF